jgi:hypothetical protein
VAGSCEYDDESSGSGATELVTTIVTVLDCSTRILFRIDLYYSQIFSLQLSKHAKTMPWYIVVLLAPSKFTYSSLEDRTPQLTKTVRHSLPQRPQDCTVQRYFLPLAP